MPYTPTSNPFIERLIGTTRREYLDRLFFWNARELERNLDSFAQDYNQHRIHQSLDGNTPSGTNDDVNSKYADLNKYAWKSHCHRLFETPVAA